MVTRRTLLKTAAAGGIGGWPSRGLTSQPPTGTGREIPTVTGAAVSGREDRVQFVEADPDYGFNYPYFLATPESFRAAPIPLQVEMNNADEELSFEEEKGRARGQVIGNLGAIVSEELGIPQLKPVFAEPDGDPVDATHQVALLDRETMLLDGTDLERIDRQLLRMADHARAEMLSDRSMHEKLVFTGSSSEGVVGERMAAMHPDEILSVSASGLNGFVLLPFEELGGYTLNYPVGVADFESILGTAYDPVAHDRVNKFYFQGGQDPKNRLKMDGGLGGHLWNDEQVYNAARAVYGPDMVADRFPRCHIAFQKAGVSAQFRIYPEMTHNPAPAKDDIIEFHRRSIEGKDVSDFGQRLELPFDRGIVIGAREPEAGESVPFTVSGEYPPPEGLVTYSWQFDDGTTGEGLAGSHAYDRAGNYDVTLTMKTAHGQRAKYTTDLAIKGTVGITAATLSRETVRVGTPVRISVALTNQAAATESIQLVLKKAAYPYERLTATEISLDAGSESEVVLEHSFEEPGDYPLQLNGRDIGTVTVREATPTPTAAPSTTETATPETETTESGGQPGFGLVPSVIGLGAVGGHLVRRYRSEE